ncbi:MAG: hypothetical protein ACYTGB_16225, partial [Planctomycetota bacterium]
AMTAAGDPGGVIAPLVLAGAYFTVLALRRRLAPLMALPAALKLVILAAALTAMKVAQHEWPIYFGLLGALLALAGAEFGRRVAPKWTRPHTWIGLGTAALSLVWAAGWFFAEEAGFGPDGGMAAIDVLIRTTLWPLLAGLVWSVRSSAPRAVVVTQLLLVAEVALLLRRFEVRWEAVPFCFAGVALAGGVLAEVLTRRGAREPQMSVLAVLSDATAGLGLVLLLARASLFWSPEGAGWAVFFWAALVVLYFVQTALDRPAAHVAAVLVYPLLVFWARSAVLDWSAIGLVLASGAMVSAAALRLWRPFREAAPQTAHVGGAAALALAGLVYALRPDECWMGLSAVGIVAGLHVFTALALRSSVFEYTGMFLAGATLLLGAYQGGTPPHRLGLVAMVLPPASYVLGEVGTRFGWRAFGRSAIDASALFAGGALVLTLALGCSESYPLLGLIGTVSLLVLAVAGAGAVRRDESRSNGVLAGAQAVGGCALVVAAALQVIWLEESMWPQIALAAGAACHLHVALRRELRAMEYTALAMLSAAYLLAFPEFGLEGSRYGLVAMALPIVFYGLSSFGRDFGWKAFTDSSYEMVVPSSAAVLVLTVFGAVGGGAWLALVVTVGALLGAGYLGLIHRSRTGRASQGGHGVAAGLVAAAVCVQVLQRGHVQFLPEAGLIA